MVLYRCSGSGGGGVPLLTNEQWDLLTTEQKQACNLTAIQQSTTGFNRGLLVNGADYIDTYLPNSNHNDVICEAYVDNFIYGNNTWGNGTNAVQFSSGTPTLNTVENAVSLEARTLGHIGYVDLGENATPYTAYIVMKAVDPSAYNVNLFSSMASQNRNQGMLIFGNPLYVTAWNDDIDTGISSTADYFVAAMQFRESGSGLGVIYGGSIITKQPTTSNRYITIGRVDPLSSVGGGCIPCDVLIKYVGVVNKAESQSTILQNIESLYNTFVRKPSSSYLPYSNSANILCEAYVDNFDSSANSWGDGTNTVEYINGTPTLNTSENAISFPTKTDGVIGYVDLGTNNTPFTAYLVGKMINPSRDERFFSCINSRSSQQGIYIACVNSNLEVDSWGNWTDTGISASENYVVAVLKFQSGGNAIGFVNNVSINKSLNACGRYITLARSDIDSSTTNAVPSDILVKYVGVVNEAEENMDILGNIVNLYNTFID